VSYARTARYWRQRRAERRLLAALVLVPMLAVSLVGAVVAGCYDTTKPTPPCSVNAHQPGCPGWPMDEHAPDGGR
jgi:hypothetical protein